MKDLKVFVSYRIDKDAEKIGDESFLPVLCGSVFGSEKVGFFRDNDGENISDKRLSYCELTVQYWGWKNTKADYKGLMHYRRFLSFSDKVYPESKEQRNNGCVSEKFYSKEIQEKYGLTRENCLSWLSKYDVIACHPIDAGKSNIQCMKDSPDYHDYKDMEKALEILRRLYPNMSAIAEEYMKGSQVRLYNCFVMRSDLYDKFCKWEFSILSELDKYLKMDKYSIKKYRTPGTIAERLFGIYCHYLKKEKNIRFKETQLVFIEDTSPKETISPFFGKDQVTIACNFNNNYAKVFSVFLISLLEKLNYSRNYEIVVLSEDISEENKTTLTGLLRNRTNIKLTFLKPFRYLEGLRLKIDNHLYTNDLFVRPLIPYILSNYGKVVVCDVDTIVKKDLAFLYDTELNGKPIGAVKDTVFYGYLNGVVPGTLSYAKKEMKLSDPYDYCNTGVLLMDLEKIRRLYSEEGIRKRIDNSNYRIFEQDLLNVLFDKQIQFLDRRWNVYTYTNPSINKCVEEAPINDFLEYQKARENPWIIHYAAHPKPWWTPRSDFGHDFWDVARLSPFYEELLGDMSFHISAGLLSEHIQRRELRFPLKKFFPSGTMRRERLKAALRRFPKLKQFLKKFDY